MSSDFLSLLQQQQNAELMHVDARFKSESFEKYKAALNPNVRFSKNMLRILNYWDELDKDKDYFLSIMKQLLYTKVRFTKIQKKRTPTLDTIIKVRARIVSGMINDGYKAFDLGEMKAQYPEETVNLFLLSIGIMVRVTSQQTHGGTGKILLFRDINETAADYLRFSLNEYKKRPRKSFKTSKIVREANKTLTLSGFDKLDWDTAILSLKEYDPLELPPKILEGSHWMLDNQQQEDEITPPPPPDRVDDEEDD